jgi:hypothetical protein
LISLLTRTKNDGAEETPLADATIEVGKDEGIDASSSSSATNERRGGNEAAATTRVAVVTPFVAETTTRRTLLRNTFRRLKSLVATEDAEAPPHADAREEVEEGATADRGVRGVEGGVESDDDAARSSSARDAPVEGGWGWARTIADATALVVDEPTGGDATADRPPPASTTTTARRDRRRAASTTAVDLTGNWTLLVDDSFASQYDNYLRRLGQPVLVRTVARSVIGSTREETMQSEDGQKLFIRGTNVRGSWERTLEASERADGGNDAAAAAADAGEEAYGRDHAVVQGHELKPMTTADGENVAVASWWEDDGRVHHSWVVGGRKYGGGDFENRRYLTDDGNILVCESTFHPRSEDGEGGGGQGQAREKACVTWRFLREGAIVGFWS